MKLKNLFILTAIIAIAFGLGFLLIPDPVAQLYGNQMSEGGLYMTRLLGASFIGYGAFTWLARDSEDSAARRALVLGLFISLLLGAVVALMGQIAGTINALGWSTVLIYALLALGYGYFAFAKTDAT